MLDGLFDTLLQISLVASFNLSYIVSVFQIPVGDIVFKLTATAEQDFPFLHVPITSSSLSFKP